MKAIFFPKSELFAKVCSHRYGAKMTYTEQTDTIKATSRYAVEYYAHKHGARVGAFINNLQIDLEDIKSAEKYGSCRFDVYFPTPYWFNPETKVIEIIPDYTSTQWTQKGIDTFGYLEEGVIKINGSAVAVGDTKTVNTPNVGPQMFTYSNGKYGWSAGEIGQSAAYERIRLHEEQVKWFYGLLGRYPSAFSYQIGQAGGAAVDIAFFLRGRNSSTVHWSNPSEANTSYGKDADSNFLGLPYVELTRELLASTPCSTRFWDWVVINGATVEQSLNAIEQLVDITLVNGGWVNNFTHWHNARDTANDNLKLRIYDAYFARIAAAGGSNNIHYCSYGEAAEYLMAKMCVDNVAAYVKGNRVRVAISLKDPFEGEILVQSGLSGKIPFDRINIPVSIEVDLSGTPLAGKNIISNFGQVINNGSGNVIVEVPIPRDLSGVIEIELYDSIQPQWLSVNKPVISNVQVSGDKATFETNIPCYSSLFEVSSVDDVELYGERYTDKLKTKHEVKIGVGASKSIGVCTSTGKTAIYDI